MEINLKDLVPVITACRKNGVSSIKIGEVDIQFGEKKEENNYNVTITQEDPSADVQTLDKSPRWDMEELALTDPSAWAAADMGDE